MLVWKSQWLSGKSSASQDGRLPVRVRRGHWSVEEGVGGTGEESGDAPGTGGRWRSSRICQDREENKNRLCFKSKYLLLNNTFFSSLYFSYLLSSLSPGLAPLSGDSCLASPHCASAPRPGFEPQSFTWKAVTLPLSHWDFHTNIAFFCALVFLNS